jgi:hypothetical protein
MRSCGEVDAPPSAYDLILNDESVNIADAVIVVLNIHSSAFDILEQVPLYQDINLSRQAVPLIEIEAKRSIALDHLIVDNSDIIRSRRDPALRI